LFDGLSRKPLRLWPSFCPSFLPTLGNRMYRSQRQQLEFPDFYLPFSGQLDPENRWVTLARLVPWELAEEIYHQDLCEDFGAPIVPSRTALGALLVKERLGLTDRETVETIQENPYLQFFLGLEEFTQERPFDASLMVDFRKRFGEHGMQRLAEAIALASLPQATDATPDDPNDSTPPSDNSPPTPSTSSKQSTEESSTNRGKLIVDATCAPADIRYPTDVSLLNEAREKTDALIDQLHQPLVGSEPRPRTYRQKARRQFVAFVKQKKPRRNKIRRANRQQLGYLKRNLQAIDRLLAHPDALPLTQLSRRDYKNLLVCRELYRQQQQMYESRTQRVDDRIVSIAQPHVRPIKRGKAGRDTEFGAKLSLSVVDGFSFVDRLSWNSYNESTDLIGQIETYRQRFGFYPESVHVDQIYRTRANRTFCKEHGIRMSGPPLGRKPQQVSAADKKQAAADEAIRNQVEGKFGQGKRRFGLGRIMAKLAGTSAAQISLSFLVMNLERALRQFFFSLVLLRHGWGRLVLTRRDSCCPPLSRLQSWALKTSGRPSERPCLRLRAPVD
jgi:IS5 family transposase